MSKGGIEFVSNTILQCDGTGTGGANCADLASQTPPAFASWSQNNDHVAEYIDIDADLTTFSSSSDSLNLPNCSEVLFAGIYWGGRADLADLNYPDRETIKIDLNGGGYETVEADEVLDAGAVEGLGNRVYYCFADITELIESHPDQSFVTVANIYSRLSGGSNRWGGWNIVVVYKDDVLPIQKLCVFDGLVNVNDLGTDIEIDVADFLTPPSGPVNFEVGVFGYDGDRGFIGDSLLFDGGTGFVEITDPLNPADDIFNSSITRNGVLSTAQFPLIENTISIDADIFKPDNSALNYIGNSVTDGTIKVVTSDETVQVQLVTFAIDVFEPDVESTVRVEDLNGGTTQPGDTLEYTVVGLNAGSDPSVDTYIVDTLNESSIYVPNSIEVIFGPNLGVKTDVGGDDQGEYIVADNVVRVNIGVGADDVLGGEVANSPSGIDSTVFTFRAVVSDDCAYLTCDNIIENRAYIFGTGDNSDNVLSNPSYPGTFDGDGCPISGTTDISVDFAACVTPADTTVVMHCEETPFADFPYGVDYSYFDNAFLPVTAASAVGTYYAINETIPGCGDTIVITITGFVPEPTVSVAGEDQTVCVDPGEATLDGNIPTAGTGFWTVSAGGATITDPTLANSEVTGLTAGLNTFVWTITNAPCPAESIDEVMISLYDLPSVAAAGDDIIVCGMDEITLDANDPPVGSGFWTVISGGGSMTDPTNFDSNVEGLTIGINVLRWTISNGDCPPSFDDITVVLNPDSDGDGICDVDDIDDDNDGVLDLVEGDTDFDTDGIINSLDLDSDNDGVPDIVEAGTDDVDGDGRVDTFVDTDDDGLANVFDTDIGGALPNDPDSDFDGLKDRQDLDADNDGTPDIIEAKGLDINGDGVLDDLTDTDSDGFADLTDTNDDTTPGDGDGGTALINPDTDIDGLDDRIDLDSDNDGISDVFENGGTDVDGDGRLDSFGDVDGDGFSDLVDTDDNTIPGTGDGGSPLNNGDADRDGIKNSLDIDSDNDGITDVIEAGGTDVDGDGQLDGFSDVDGDGFSDVVDTDDNTIPGTDDGGTSLDVPNTDLTGRVDFLDIDSDGDGIIDNIEAQSSSGYIEPTGIDTDGDGLDNAYDSGDTFIVPYNHDGDLLPDYLDLNSDNDDEDDIIEGHDLDGDGTPETIPSGIDPDNDGLDDAFDIVVLAVGTSWTNAGNNTVDPLLDGVLGDTDAPGIGDLDFRENDSDADGVDDALDLDDDNDGIIDTNEGDSDSDNDGIVASLDLDSDNDGIPDLIEAGGIDVDGDGKVDGFEDLDLDGLDDGIAGSPLIVPDSDNDGLMDTQDLDSDNDGLADLVEAGGDDLDGDGVADDLTDIDLDGFSDTYDTDDNTVTGAGDGGIALLNPNTDGDSEDNRSDLDSDNDGIADVVEAGGDDINGDGVLDGFTDVDADGFSDVTDTDNNTIPGAGDGGTTLENGDFDRDQLPNALDLDSDNDGIADVKEAGGDDINRDGLLDDFSDVDGDGFSDVVDTDDNTLVGEGDGGTALIVPNSDANGGNDSQDLDSDGDGISDNIEGQSSQDYIAVLGVDTDSDGLDDAYDIDAGGLTIDPIDTDDDDLSDYLDLDSDNDGDFDLIEGWDINGDDIADTAPLGVDSDGDGLDDAFDVIVLTAGTATTNGGNGTIDPFLDGVLADFDLPGLGDLDFRESNIDTDGDGIPNVLDLDDDNDGIPDLVEDLNEDGDDDPMTDPTDTDGDGIIDIFDLDSDNDGLTDIIEAGGTDENGDGLIDDLAEDGSLLNDNNNNGLDDLFDSSIGGEDIPNPDSDGDGIPDFQDLDSDGDGIYDVIEGGGVDANGDGLLDGFEDENGDGLHDDGSLSPPDTDEDGIDDYLDLDSDNDSVPDEIENDPNNDGTGPDDSDNDGIRDYLDSDDDNDDIPTIEESENDGADNYEDCNGNGSPDYLDPVPCTLFIPDGFSPDGDGINDYFVIVGIEGYPNASIVIFNRWGSKVYESTGGYGSDWDGTNQFGLSTGERDLPVGTYYYVLDLGDEGNNPIKGYVFINK